MAYLKEEPSSVLVSQLLKERFGKPGALFMHEINVGEVWYILARKAGEKSADIAINQLQMAGIEIVSPGWKTTRLAASFKARGGLSFPDAFAGALAKTTGASLVTGDHEFAVISEEVDILWLR
jgi:predicted nucleic acid-binding protein